MDQPRAPQKGLSLLSMLQSISEHIVRSSSSNDNQIVALNSFFDANILTWIEIVAEAGNSYFLTQTAKAYMERRAKYRSPLGQQVQAVNCWIKNLIYIITSLEAIRFLEFGSSNTLQASGGRRNIVLWDVTTGTRLWAINITQRLLALGFNEDDTILMATTIANYTSIYNVEDGEELEKFFVFDQRPTNLWDLESKSYIGQFHKSAPDVYPGPLLVAMVFNPNPDINLAAASYQDGDLVVFDLWNQRQHAITETNAHILAASSDGATLATGDGIGTIQEPSAIVRQTVDGDGSSEYCSEDVVGDAETVEIQLWDDSQAITAMVGDGTDFLFCGKENGAVVIYEAKTGQQTQELYRHAANATILLLEWNHQANILASIDRSSRVQVRRIS
ncbi:MAG: hypothetical protein Q9166_004700 [cf. Caloplaca sp. 2 TL-2023]